MISAGSKDSDNTMHKSTQEVDDHLDKNAITIAITNDHLLQCASEMNPSVSLHERAKYKKMYVMIVL